MPTEVFGARLETKPNTTEAKKTGMPIELPLLKDVGEAIIDYLKYGRPQYDLEYVFLKHMAPYEGVTHAAFFTAIKTGMRRAGIEFQGKRKHGPHALRHSLATMLLEKETPLLVITGIKNGIKIRPFISERP